MQKNIEFKKNIYSDPKYERKKIKHFIITFIPSQKHAKSSVSVSCYWWRAQRQQFVKKNDERSASPQQQIWSTRCSAADRFHIHQSALYQQWVTVVDLITKSVACHGNVIVKADLLHVRAKYFSWENLLKIFNKWLLPLDCLLSSDDSLLQNHP